MVTLGIGDPRLQLNSAKPTAVEGISITPPIVSSVVLTDTWLPAAGGESSPVVLSALVDVLRTCTIFFARGQMVCKRSEAGDSHHVAQNRCVPPAGM